MTLLDAKRAVAELGLILIKLEDGEYIVKFRNTKADDPRTYYTTDLADAVGTAKTMAKGGVR
jgi:hypothetical protein